MSLRVGGHALAALRRSRQYAPLTLASTLNGWKRWKSGKATTSDQPFRHPVRWTEEEYYDEEKLDTELRRVFDACHSCRRCFNLCDSFPRLFQLIDDSKSGDLDTVDSSQFKEVADNCTLCDMCYLTKCPYVPPHPLNLDFPHLMVRYRAVENKKANKNAMKDEEVFEASAPPLEERGKGLGETAGGMFMGNSDPTKVEEGVSRTLTISAQSFAHSQLAYTDRNAKMAAIAPRLVNWFSHTDNKLSRQVIEYLMNIDKDAALPQFVSKSKSLVEEAKRVSIPINTEAKAYGKKKAVIFSTCYGNWNTPDIGLAAVYALSRMGVEVEVVNPGCCGMPLLEDGKVGEVAKSALSVSKELLPYIEKGYDVVSLVPSCSLMLKSEWPLITPNSDSVKKVASTTFDVSEYIVSIANEYGMEAELNTLPKGVALHFACHSRAQNMGNKAGEMLKLIPNSKVTTIEKCSGHGGSWGCKKPHFDTAIKVGTPAFRQVVKAAKPAPPRASGGSAGRMSAGGGMKFRFGASSISPSSSTQASTESKEKVQDGGSEKELTKEERKKIVESARPELFLSSECPLAGTHLEQGVFSLDKEVAERVGSSLHPVELFAFALGYEGRLALNNDTTARK
eukprot:CAMPEP_0113882022 /NCGR_PEP_ID=MMETSP0780_2-20120614/8710_1 /TAXON_ID=652834 /ORGANISM="Palpitomonas bilix" /LENGTH=621 /DNA_ID=CAMNT_0000868963 /DNA_START=183 /DNA_END=2048 /DNA_ORIENTATION=- /assembly_acc=CAM_ASM_000599